MKILLINVVCGIRSTGRICSDLAVALEKQGHTVKIAYGREKVPEQYSKYAVRIGKDLDVKIHGLAARSFDMCGWGSKKATEMFIKWVKEYNPDVIHLHNIHGYYINVKVLFDYIRDSGKKIIWTLHDCWAFTGHAAFCGAEHCERWTKGCYACPKKADYPASLIDNSKINWYRKRSTFTGIPNLTIVTPSRWLGTLVKKSFLKKYPVKVIKNGIDTSVFKPTLCKTVLKMFNIKNKKIILGVAAVWDKRKGLSDFIKLREMLDLGEYTIVLVGLNKKQINTLPDGIIGIERTDSIDELVELYSVADIFVNLTYEDNYPTTNLEAIACGTPVITYDTGGSGESASLYGRVIKQGDIIAVAKTIINWETPENRLQTNETIDIARMLKSYITIISDR